ncbi:MAG TPA: hypothetical protein VKQ71_13585, partial [Acidimicrobiales bacterium]|nr:hypothetical protein [Acidimicrobiales bacterium]
MGTVDQAISSLEGRWATSGASDGLPICPPTGSAVEEMLAGGLPGETILAPLPPGMQPLRVVEVATCAVMAGCRAGVLPIVLAALAGVSSPEFNLLGVSTTTGNAAVGLIVHGDAAVDAGITGGGNCLGPTPASNAAIGRAVAVCLRLLAGAVPGGLDMATLGQPSKYGLCLTEAALPDGWLPLHAERGVTSGSAVTVFASSGILEIADASARTGDELVATLAAAVALPTALGHTGSGGGHHIVLLPPEWAARMAADGWTRSAIAHHLCEHAVLPLECVPAHLRPLLPDGEIRFARSPDEFLFPVAG